MDNLFKATKRESAVDIVVNSIKQLLADKKLLPGDKLPNELEISEGLGVSRGSVREAMKILSAFGLIDIRVGNGTYVSDSPSSELLDSLLFTYFITNPDLTSLYEFRRIFETDIVRLAIDHYDENQEQRNSLRENLKELDALIQEGAAPDKILKMIWTSTYSRRAAATRWRPEYTILSWILSVHPSLIPISTRMGSMYTRHTLRSITSSNQKPMMISRNASNKRLISGMTCSKIKRIRLSRPRADDSRIFGSCL